jgi:hypothetical protein
MMPGSGPTGPRIPHAPDTSTQITEGGRILSEATARAAARPVPLNIMSRQAPGLVEEWTDDGSMTFRAAVRAKRWNKTEHMDTADRAARYLDVMKKSGLDLTRESSAEVVLRDLAAVWYADQHSKDSQTADLLRESSRATEGIPRSMWTEAQAYRKILRGSNTD